MEFYVTKAMWQAVVGPEHEKTRAHLDKFWALNADRFRWTTGARPARLSGVPHEVLSELSAVFNALGVNGSKKAYRTLETYIGSHTADPNQETAKSVDQWVLLCRRWFAAQERQWVYRQEADEWCPYLVTDVEYHPPRKYKRQKETFYEPPYASLMLHHAEFGNFHSEGITISEGACRHETVIDGLRNVGLFMETEGLRQHYEEEETRWRWLADRIGFQCLARGTGDDSVDGNKHGDDRHDRWYWKRNEVSLDPRGEASKVVIDVFYEEGKEGHSGNVPLSYWHHIRAELANKVKRSRNDLTLLGDPDEDDDDDSEVDNDSDQISDEERAAVPIYPALVVFDLRRHMRLRVHVNQLEDYVYNPKLGASLILPADVRDLVSVLLTQRTIFRDVIEGKSGGVVVLCAGPPGTGKTLTAEIYSEVMRRPLYAVQTAQLGTTAWELENELRRVFARAARWGAILLLDEADVYVRHRGDDLDQNAIVAVFLRVLEYYHGVLFLTTNRVDSVDDAIASRCLARIDYKIPLVADQAKIWRVLSSSIGVDLSDDEIGRITTEFNDLSGRDIKNLLKLSAMIATARRETITLDTIRFVSRFKPTGPSSVYDDREGGGIEFVEEDGPTGKTRRRRAG